MLIPADETTLRFGIPVNEPGPRPGIPVRRVPDLFDSLVAAIAAKLTDAPCYVSFSGGCDSTLVLAAAAQACRRRGHDDPIAVSLRYPHAADTEESTYQEAAVRAFELAEWEIITLGRDGDVLGDAATTLLAAVGPAWPAPGFVTAAAHGKMPPGLLLTGEGGDEVFGRRRVTPFVDAARRAVRERRPPSRHTAALIAGQLTHRRGRAVAFERRLAWGYEAPWLAPELRRELFRRVAHAETSEPLDPRSWPAHHLSLGRVAIGANNLASLEAMVGHELFEPLLSPGFMGAIAGTIPWFRFRAREAILERYFSSHLPPIILHRRSKASFNGAYFGEATREFASRWDGRGLPSGVDEAWLAEHWRTAETIHAGTALLLQAAWCASRSTAGAPEAGEQP